MGAQILLHNRHSLFYRDYFQGGNISFAKPWITYTQPDLDMITGSLLKGYAIFHHQAFVNITYLDNKKVGSSLRENLIFKNRYLNRAKATIKKVLQESKMKEDPLRIGIHVRKGDWDEYARVKNIPMITPEYYLNAMKEMERKLGTSNLVFLLITDDIKWCKTNLQVENLFIVSDFKRTIWDGIGHDLAVMSMCQHSIISWGSFSSFVGFFAGGYNIAPNGVKFMS